jgi:hypothetical protein
LNTLKIIALLSALIIVSLSAAYGRQAEDSDPAEQARNQTSDGEDSAAENASPWLFVPIFSNAPKLGTSLGAMGAYLHRFDDGSPTSTFGVMGTYSNTESLAIAAFSRMYFDQDKQRLLFGAMQGEVNNEYSDFLGTGYEVKTTDEIHAIFSRYLYGIKDDWYLGPQVLSTNYAISGNDYFSQGFLERIGLTGFNSNGVGMVLERDTRNDQNSPESGSWLNFNNVAYREGLGGDYSFDAYAVTAATFFRHGKSNILAARIDGRWTHDAPAGGYSTVRLRGYTMGQYLAPHATLIELEERYVIKNRLGGTLFAGVASLYGDDLGVFDRDNLYPSIGAGITYVLKVEDKMIARFEVARGEGENYGFYLKLGYEF